MKRKIMTDLIAWKNKDKRKPLLVNGARQVGKTYIIKQFGKENYKNVVYVNFETNDFINTEIDSNITPKSIINKLELYFGEEILPEKTLIFFDEIQANERALTALKYFNEDANEYHVIAAGSLLGVAINRNKSSFPVGKVNMLTLFPLSFEEFLWAINREKLSDEIKSCFIHNRKMDEELHELSLEVYRKYLIVGGMPEVVKEYVDTGKLISIIDIQGAILDSYQKDMTKYSSYSESNKIIAAFNSIPIQLAKDNQKFQYKIVLKGGTSTIFGPALDWLQSAGVVTMCYKVTPSIPLEMYKNITSFKVYMNDTGLFVNKAKYPLFNIDTKEIPSMISMGPLVENYVANELRIKLYCLYYWESEGKAEVDFVIQKESDIIPIEVKSGLNTKSRSLTLFLDRYPSRYGIRISEKNFGFDGKIKSIPLYAVFCI